MMHIGQVTSDIFLEKKCRNYRNKRLERYYLWKFFFFSQPAKNDERTYDNIQKVKASPGSDYTAGCILDYVSFKNCYKMIAIDLSKQQTLDADPKAIQQINFVTNVDRAGQAEMYFIVEEAKEIVLNFSERTVRVL